MARLRNHKKILREQLESDQWKSIIPSIVDMDPKQATGPLLSFLLLGGDMTHRSAYALGQCIAKMAEAKPEDARNIMRRLMWHMNEESGNIGWGIPEAFAEILVHSEKMAKEFHSILLSYIIDTGRDDNYCDHALLRRSCYWAVGRLVGARPELCDKIIPWLMKNIAGAEEDTVCRAMAVWALGQFPKGQVPSFEVFPILRTLQQGREEELAVSCSIFDGQQLQSYTLGQLLEASPLLPS